MAEVKQQQDRGNRKPAGLVGRALIWLLGTAFFFTVAVLPGVRLGWWYETGGRVHSIVLPLAAVLVVLLWLTSLTLSRRGRPRADD